MHLHRKGVLWEVSNQVNKISLIGTERTVLIWTVNSCFQSTCSWIGMLWNEWSGSKSFLLGNSWNVLIITAKSFFYYHHLIWWCFGSNVKILLRIYCMDCSDVQRIVNIANHHPHGDEKLEGSSSENFFAVNWMKYSHLHIWIILRTTTQYGWDLGGKG